jgi:lactaldehyde dehydrogenase/glycolaldehyde dehydrogenase
MFICARPAAEVVKSTKQFNLSCEGINRMSQSTDYCNFIAGKFVPETTNRNRIVVTNPATQEVLGTVPDSGPDDVDAALAAAEAAQEEWAARPSIERAKFLHAIAAKVRHHQEELARTITQEQGKILDLARVEVSFTADYFDYMAEWARRIEGEILESDRPGEVILLFRQPVGVVVGILPWNFPFFLIARKAAPALVTGNTIVIKPSEETPLNAVKFCELIAEAGLPPGVINVVHGSGPSAGKALCSSKISGLISFTGSVETGSAIMAAASQNITRVNLELGGKAPAIVMADADIDLAVKAVKASRVINSGQVCNCVERVYVQSKVAAAFTDKLAQAMQSTRFGDPLADSSVEYGPLINEEAYSKVERLVQSAVKEGASIVTGGGRGPDERGYYYQPTVLTDCRQEMEITRSEIFGPVVPIIAFDDLDQAIHYANDSEYGLTSSIYTRDLNVALKACRKIRFGETYINRENFEAMQGFHAGWRKSGIGGADGKHGLYEFMQTHVVYLQSY